MSVAVSPTKVISRAPTSGTFGPLLAFLEVIGSLILYLGTFMPNALLTVASVGTISWSLGKRMPDKYSAIMAGAIVASTVIYFLVSTITLGMTEDDRRFLGVVVVTSNALLQSLILHAVVVVPFAVYGVGWRVVQRMRDNRRARAVEIAGEEEEEEGEA